MPPTSSSVPASRRGAVAVLGAGPSGLMAAETLASAGVEVDVYDAMPSVGRKFLLAGKGGLNLTHAEPFAAFIERYSQGRVEVAGWLDAFGPAALRSWAEGLGVRTFVGSSGRVFPIDLKAAPLLRAWLHRLRKAGVRFHTRCRWTGWGDDGSSALRLQTREGEISIQPAACVLALGGASWPQLGSDGAWVALLGQRGIDVTPLRAANCGFEVTPAWSDHFRARAAGQAVKTAALAVVGDGDSAPPWRRKGEFVITDSGVEGSLVYAASAAISAQLAAQGQARLEIDLLPDREIEWVHAELARPRGSRSLATHLKSRLHLDGVKAALLHERLTRPEFVDVPTLASRIKALPLVLAAARPLAEAISSAGGVRFDQLTSGLMLERLPGLFCAGEMLDWDAPTGGYLLTACMASGVVSARGVLVYLSA